MLYRVLLLWWICEERCWYTVDILQCTVSAEIVHILFHADLGRAPGHEASLVDPTVLHFKYSSTALLTPLLYGTSALPLKCTLLPPYSTLLFFNLLYLFSIVLY